MIQTRTAPVSRDRAHVGPPAIRVLVAALVTALVLAGCGLRLETPAPEEPVPDATEVVRRRSVEDSLALERASQQLAAASATPVTEVLSQVASYSTAHGEQLGGTYYSGIAEPEASGTPTPTSPATTPPDPTALLAVLATTAGTARADADTVTDGGLARLLASVAASRARLLASLAAALGVDAPPIVTPAPDPAVASGGSPAPSADATTATAPALSGGPDLSAVVVAEDEAGYAFEVIAAKLDEPVRSRAVAAGAAHRSRAEQWAAALDPGLPDPRRAAYTLPGGLDDPATALGLALSLETALTAQYASAIADTGPGGREGLIESLLVADTDAASWGAPAFAFPGLTEQVG